MKSQKNKKLNIYVCKIIYDLIMKGGKIWHSQFLIIGGLVGIGNNTKLSIQKLNYNFFRVFHLLAEGFFFFLNGNLCMGSGNLCRGPLKRKGFFVRLWSQIIKI